MADESLLAHMEFDVTPFLLKWVHCVTQKLVLEEEEAVMKISNCLGKAEKRLPYGELGSVDEIRAYCICYGFRSDLSELDPRTNERVPMVPDCGCSGGKVTKIVEELKARMKGRGDTGNIHRSEECMMRQKYMNDKLQLLLKHLGRDLPDLIVPADDPAYDLDVFTHEQYDVSPGYCNALCCRKDMLYLEPEEVLLTTSTLCLQSTKRFPYGQLGSVDTAKTCCCCVMVKSAELGAISPGFGCDVKLVDEIAGHLKTRMKGRGDTGNIKRQEFANKLVIDSDAMVNVLLEYQRVMIPAMPEGLSKAPNQAKM